MEEPYEKLKAFTRGQAVTQESMQSFVRSIEGLPEDAKEDLAKLQPRTYIGNAVQQAHALDEQISNLMR